MGRFKTGVPIFSSVAVLGNALYVADFAGNVYRFILNKGSYIRLYTSPVVITFGYKKTLPS